MAHEAGSNQRKPRIGVTGNHRRFSPSWFFLRLSIWMAGGEAIRVSIKHDADKRSMDALVISGGDDIHPSLYTDESHGDQAMAKATYDQPRDELEQEFIRYGLEHDLPMLGICRGHQLINVTLGGDLHTDIRDKRQNTSNRGTVLPRKTALLEPDSMISDITGKEKLRVNSLHHQAVEETGDGIDDSGHDLDGFIQAAEDESSDLLGVQWHPEYLFYQSSSQAIFRWLVDAAVERFNAREKKDDKQGDKESSEAA